MFSEDDYDFVARHPRTHVVVGPGQRREQHGPLGNGTGRLLVAGNATLGRFETIARLPEPQGTEWEVWPSDQSADGRWLAMPGEDNTLTLFDLHAGTPGFSFITANCRAARALHPSGEWLAERTPDAVCMRLPDGKLWRELPFPQSDQRYRVGQSRVAETGETLTFTADGKYLWFTHVGPDGDRLLLLEVPNLTTVDVAGVPIDDEGDSRWWETAAFLNFPDDCLWLLRQAGDSLLGVTAYQVAGGKILASAAHFDVEAGAVNGDPINEIIFSADGRRFTAVNGYDMIFTGDARSMVVDAETGTSAFGHGIFQDFGGLREIGSVGAVVLARGEDGILHFLNRDLEWRGAHRFEEPVHLLPDGTLLRRLEGAVQVSKMHVDAAPLPVVFELDWQDGSIVRAVRQRDNGWEDIRSEVMLCEPAFRFQD